MTKTLRFAFAAPLALALAACGSGAEQSGEIQGDAIAAIPAPAIIPPCHIHGVCSARLAGRTGC